MLVKYVSDCCAFLQLGLFLGGNSSDNLEKWSSKFVANAFPRGFARGESFAKPKKNQNSIQPSWAFREDTLPVCGFMSFHQKMPV